MVNTRSRQVSLGKIGEFALILLGKYEIHIIIIALFSVILNILKVQFGEIILTIPFISLSTLYYARSYAMSGNDTVTIRERNIDKFYYYTLSIAVLGILFQLNGWYGSNFILTFGGIGLIISVGLILILKPNLADSKILDKNTIPRIIIILAIVLLLKLLPHKLLVENDIIRDIPKLEQEDKDK
jgi:hypothetical protein